MKFYTLLPCGKPVENLWIKKWVNEFSTGKVSRFFKKRQKLEFFFTKLQFHVKTCMRFFKNTMQRAEKALQNKQRNANPFVTVSNPVTVTVTVFRNRRSLRLKSFPQPVENLWKTPSQKVKIAVK